MPSNYLKRHYLKDQKLAQRALLEFSRAMRTGRLIAFTGAMTTEAFGYGSWSQLKKQFIGNAIRLLDRIEIAASVIDSDGYPRIVLDGDVHFQMLTKRIREIEGQSASEGAKLDANVTFSLIEEVLDCVKIASYQPQFVQDIAEYLNQDDLDWPLDNADGALSPVTLLRLKTAIQFRKPHFDPAGAPSRFADLESNYNVPAALMKAIGIQRFATLNYDFELERLAMAPLDIPEQAATFNSPFSELLRERRRGERPFFQWDLGSGRIRKVLPSGLVVESDILNRERIDRMFEFAIGTDDVETHVIHMHGRACTPRSMLVSYRDYDRLYRHNDLGRMPFEHAKKVLVGGNPILFIGLGMTEAEVNKELEDFISNSPYRRVAPTFLLWNTRGTMTKAEREERRLDWLHRLGVLAIFDDDLSRFNDLLGHQNLPQMSWFRPTRQIKAPKRLKARAAWYRERDVDGQKIGTRALYTRIQKAKQSPSPSAKDRPILVDLARAARLLPEVATMIGQREEYIPVRDWRSMTTVAQNNDEEVYFWRAELDCSALQDEPEELQDAWNQAADGRAAAILQETRSHNIVCVIGAAGAAKGLVARRIITSTRSAFYKPGNRVFVTSAFHFDTDSLLDGIACFLGHQDRLKGYERSSGPPPMSRQAFFKKAIRESIDEPGDEYLIIINGMDRFFSTPGLILSAELDSLLQLVALETEESRIKWVFLGTERIRKYFTSELAINRRGDRLGRLTKIMPFGAPLPTINASAARMTIPAVQMNVAARALARKLRSNNSPHLSELAPSHWRALQFEISRYEAHTAGAISGDMASLRSAFYTLCLSPIVLKAALGPLHDLVTEVIRVLAFLGAPVEFGVLQHVPSIQRHKDKHLLLKALCQLWRLGLLLNVRPFKDYKFDGSCEPPPPELPGKRAFIIGQRYALHRSAIRELRYRFGIPLSEAKLSTAFNMSLYVAQPIDGHVPEVDVHDELGELIDRLIGSYKDKPVQTRWAPADWQAFRDDRGNAQLAEAVRLAYRLQDPIRSAHDAGEEGLAAFFRLCRADHIQSLRAALAVIRGFYATTGLLTVDEGDRLLRPDRDGVLLEHAERLDTLIDAFGKLMKARNCLFEQYLAVRKPENDEAVRDAKIVFGRTFGSAGPFYADELVWLHNERGVVRLAMGDLYEAKRSFTLAMKVNRENVEFEERNHNWRRIRLNQLTVDIEQGEIDVALRRIDEIINQSQGLPLHGSKNADRHFPLREDKLAIAICTGYRAFCLHLRGHRNDALKLYERAIEQLSDLEELRAQAYFARLRAEVTIYSLDLEEKRRALKAAHDLALSGRQLDIAYRIQVAEALATLREPNLGLSERRRANRLLEDAIRYSLQCDAYRVRCEAAAAIAISRFATGDYEGALTHVTDALTIAVRYGMELRKMTLRALLGRILAARGHPITAQHLAQMCIKVASRQNVQTAIDRGEECLQDIPRFSITLEKSDLSGRRDF